MSCQLYSVRYAQLVVDISDSLPAQYKEKYILYSIVFLCISTNLIWKPSSLPVLFPVAMQENKTS